MSDLLTDVGMQVAGEAQDVTHDLIGNHVAEQAPHVGQGARVGNQLGEDVVLQADGEGLDPSEPVRAGEHQGSELAENGIRTGHDLQGGLLIGRVGELRVRGGGL